MYLLMYKFSGYLTELVLEIITVLFTLGKINELTCAYMFSQAHLQKNTHKKVFSLVEKSNIYCVFLLRNANIFSFAC
jgi:hypothetical protein